VNLIRDLANAIVELVAHLARQTIFDSGNAQFAEGSSLLAGS
jgi:hypothetical protein